MQAYFNPRTRVGCDSPVSVSVFTTYRISIHAPAWGATMVPAVTGGVAPRFQSTHPRGVRLDALGAGINADNFNPRTRVGCDINISPMPSLSQISIHAPAWGATASLPNTEDRHRYFNPRTRVGCDILKFANQFHRVDISIHAPAWGATV